jgi:cytochrome P450
MGEVSSTLPPNCHPQAYVTAIAQKYNLTGIFYIDLWPVADSMVVLTDPDLMDKVTVFNPLPMHPMAEDFMSPIVGKNVIATTNGALWKKAHHAMAPAFSWSHIRSLVPVVVEEGILFRDTLDKLAQSGEVFSMEKTSAKLIFDVIGRIVFNFPLHAQTKGSPYLKDFRDMIHLADAQLSWNPFVKISAFFKRKTIFDRLQVSIVGKINERLNLLRSEGIVPSRKDPFSILDLMLREYVQEEDGGNVKGKSWQELSPQYFESLVTK